MKEQDDNTGKEADLWADDTMSYVIVFTISRLARRLDADSKLLLTLPGQNQFLSQTFHDHYMYFQDIGMPPPYHHCQSRISRQALCVERRFVEH